MYYMIIYPNPVVVSWSTFSIVKVIVKSSFLRHERRLKEESLKGPVVVSRNSITYFSWVDLWRPFRIRSPGRVEGVPWLGSVSKHETLF